MWKSYENQLFSWTIVICCKCCSLATYFSYIFMCKNYDLIGMTYLSRWFLIEGVLQGCRITNVFKAFLMKYNSYHLERMTIAMIVRLTIWYLPHHQKYCNTNHFFNTFLIYSRCFCIPLYWYWIDACLWCRIWSMQKIEKYSNWYLVSGNNFSRETNFLQLQLSLIIVDDVLIVMSIFVVWKDMKLLSQT